MMTLQILIEYFVCLLNQIEIKTTGWIEFGGETQRFSPHNHAKYSRPSQSRSQNVCMLFHFICSFDI